MFGSGFQWSTLADSSEGANEGTARVRSRSSTDPVVAGSLSLSLPGDQQSVVLFCFANQLLGQHRSQGSSS